jgi:hypothetical protein
MCCQSSSCFFALSLKVGVVSLVALQAELAALHDRCASLEKQCFVLQRGPRKSLIPSSAPLIPEAAAPIASPAPLSVDTSPPPAHAPFRFDKHVKELAIVRIRLAVVFLFIMQVFLVVSSFWNYRIAHAVNMNDCARSWHARRQLTCASSHGCAFLCNSGTSPNASPQSLHSDKSRKKDHSPARSSNLVPVSQPVGEALSSARRTESMESPSRQALSASLSMSVTTAVAEVQPALVSAAAQVPDKPLASGMPKFWIH